MTKTAAQRQREYKARKKTDAIQVKVTVPTLVREALVEQGQLDWDKDRDRAAVGSAIQAIIDHIKGTGNIPHSVK